MMRTTLADDLPELREHLCEVTAARSDVADIRRMRRRRWRVEVVRRRVSESSLREAQREVERREFIERYALEAKNLDV